MTFVRTIIHEIPRGTYKSDGDAAPRISSTLTELTPQSRRFITDKFIYQGSPAARDIVEDPGRDSNEMKALLTRCLRGDSTEFIAASGVIADKLFRAQSGNAPAGVLIISLVHDPDPELLILKADHQEGMKVTESRDADGNKQLNLEHLEDLIVGGDSKIFKTARLSLHNEGEDGDCMSGVMVDLQSGGSGYAEYFLSAFLESVLANPDTKMTRLFDSTVESFIQAIPDLDERITVAKSYNTYRETNPEFEVSTKEFAERYLTDSQAEKFVPLVPDALRGRIFRMDHTAEKRTKGGWKLSSPGVYLVVDSSAVVSGEVRITQNEDGSANIRISKNLQKFTLVNAPAGSLATSGK